MSAGSVKNACVICNKPFSESEKAFLIGPVYTNSVQYDDKITIDRIGTIKRDLLHSECWEGVISKQKKKDERLVELDERVHDEGPGAYEWEVGCPP